MKGSLIHARVTIRQKAIIEAVAEAEGITVSDLIVRGVLAFVWEGLHVDPPRVGRPAEPLRLHDFPRIARALDEAAREERERMEREA